MVRGIYILLLVFSPCYLIAAKPPVTVTQAASTYNISSHCEYYHDTTGISPASLASINFEPVFSQDIYAKPGSIWVRFAVKNASEWTSFMLTIDQWTEADLLYYEGERLTVVHSGTSVPVAERPESFHRLLSFPLTLGMNETQVYYLHLTNRGQLTKNYAALYDFLKKMEFEEASYSRSKFRGNQLAIVFVMGIAFILFLYNVGLYLYIKEIAFALLALYLLAAAVFIANIHGITTNYLFRWVQSFEFLLAIVLYHLISILLILFIKYYLNIKAREWLNWLVMALVGFMLLSLTISLIEQRSFWYFPRRYFELGVLLVVLSVSVWERKEGARLLFFAVLIAMAGNFYSDFIAVSANPDLFVFSDMAYLGGLLIQFSLLSLGSSYRVYRLNRTVIKSETDRRQMLEEQNLRLNQLVEERTSLLQQKNEELVQTQIKIKQQNQDIEKQNQELNEVNFALLSKNIEIGKQTQQLTRAAKKINELNESLEEEVKLRTTRLEQALSELDTFLYRSSHDMRRPLTTILGLLHLIEKEQNLQQIPELTAKASRTIQGIDRMLEKLIVVHQSLNKAQDLKKIDVRATILQAVEFAKETYQTCQAAFDIQVPDGLTVYSSSSLFTAIVKYCIENAIVFCREDNVHITISAKEESETLLLEITDDGQGIDQQVQEQVFNMFFRGHESSMGNGLGLYVVKKCMDALNGSVAIFSDVRTGTTVALRFPLLQEAAIAK